MAAIVIAAVFYLPVIMSPAPVPHNIVAPGSNSRLRQNPLLFNCGWRGTLPSIVTSVLASGKIPQPQFRGFSHEVLYAPVQLVENFNTNSLLTIALFTLHRYLLPYQFVGGAVKCKVLVPTPLYTAPPDSGA